MNNTQPFIVGQQASGTILVVDDQQLVSSTLAFALRDKGFDAHSIGVTDLDAVQTAALAYLPGLVLLDLDLGSGPDGQPMDGVDLIGPLRAQGWTVLVITGTASLDRIADAVAHGAANWVVKGATFAELVHAAVEIMHGRGQLLPAQRADLIERYRTAQAAQRESGKRLSRLSPRERVVLARLTEGLNAATIATESFTSIRTVQTHIHRILTKLDVNSQGAAIAIAVRNRRQPPPINPSLWRRMHSITEDQPQKG